MARTDLNQKAKLTVYLSAFFVAAILTAVALMTSSAWGGSAHASALEQSKGKGGPLAGSSKGANPDDVPYLINESFVSDNLSTSAFHSEVSTCQSGSCPGWTTTDSFYVSPIRSAYGAGPNHVSDQQLELNSPVQIPATAISATLEFSHYYNLEATGTVLYDAGVLEVSTDGGTTWSDSGVQFISGGYNGTVAPGGNPLTGRQAWGGDTATFTPVKADLISYAGHDILIRFREGTDTSNDSLGWVIDDIVLTVNTPAPCAQHAWSLATDYTLPVKGPASVVFNGQIYMFGGENSSSNPASESYRFVSSTNSWVPIAALPSGRSYATATSDGKYIYVLGGKDSGGNPTGNVWRYDPVANTYTSLANMPHALWGHAAFAFAGKIYRVGGFDSQTSATFSDDIYNIATNAWSAGPVMPQPMAAFASVQEDNFIYIIGGYVYSGAGLTVTSKTYGYNLYTNAWEDGVIADLPSPRAMATGALLNGRIVVAGGYNASGYLGSVITLNPVTYLWASLPDMPQPARWLGSGVLNQTLYVVAGDTSQNAHTVYNRQYSGMQCVATPSPTPPACNVSFSDVPTDHTFYSYITCLACRGIVSGYQDGTFKPGNPVTRGQIAKIVSNSAGYAEDHNTQTFEDISIGSTFYIFAERLAFRSIITGYSCGGPGEPCGANGKPYFRPNSNATRGQLAKIVCTAYECLPPLSDPVFADVPVGHTFYNAIGALYALGAINGYPCGGPGEPCGPNNLPYFRPGANISRGQTTKIVGTVYFSQCPATSSKQP